MTPLETVLEVVDGARKSGSGWSAKCPAHEDRKPSLSISEGADGKVLLYCQAGCDFASVVAALPLETGDLFPPKDTTGKRIVAEYPYTDETGAELFQAVRFEPKDFRQRHRVNGSAWEWNLNGTRRVLYRLPELLEGVKAGATVYVCEGEKDVEAIRSLGLVATCNPMGAGKWRDEYAKALIDARVVVIADKDEPDKKTGRRPGQDHAAAIEASVRGKAASVCVVEVPEGKGKDAADWIAAGATREDFEKLLVATPEPKGEGETPREPPSVASHLRNGTYLGPRYKTGLPPLDALLTPYNPAPLETDAPRIGLYPTKAVALIGAPGGGKTTFAAQLVHDALAVPGSRVVCLVVDEPGREFSAKLAQLAGWPLADVDNAPKREEMLRRLDETFPLDRLMIVPTGEEDMTIEDAAELLFEKSAVLPVLLIDSASEATSRLTTRGDSEQETTNRNVLAIKRIKAQGALVIYTAEPTKSGYASKDPEQRTTPMASMAFGRKATHGMDLAILLEEIEDDTFRFNVFKNRITGNKGIFDVLLDREKRRFGAITKDEAEKRQEESAIKKESFDDERVMKAVEKWAPKSDEGGLTDEEIRVKARMGKTSADASRKRLVKFGRLEPFKPERQPGQVGQVAWYYRLGVPGMIATRELGLTQTNPDSTQTKSGMSEGGELTQTPPLWESELITPTGSESAPIPRTAAVHGPSLRTSGSHAETPSCALEDTAEAKPEAVSGASPECWRCRELDRNRLAGSRKTAPCDVCGAARSLPSTQDARTATSPASAIPPGGVA